MNNKLAARILRFHTAAGAAVLLLLALTSQLLALEPPKDYGLIARVLVGMLGSEHYNHHTVDDKVSNELFNEYLKFLDPSKMYFTKKDVDTLRPFNDKLDDDLKAGDMTFAYDTFNIFIDKVKKREAFAKTVIEKGFDFTSDESFEFDRATTPWADSEEQLDELWRKKLKNDFLTLRLMERATKEDEAEAKKNKPAVSEKADAEKDNQQSAAPDAAPKKPAAALKSPEERIMKRLEGHRRHLEDY